MPVVLVICLAFIALVAISSTGVLPARAVSLASDTSRWLPVIAIAPAGVQTSFEDLMKFGWQPVVMLLVETLFIALFLAAPVAGLRPGMS